MEARTQHSTLQESDIIERVARIVFSVRGAKPDYTRLARELEQQAVPFDVFGVVLLRHDRQAVRATVCQRDQNSQWIAALHQHPLVDSMLEKTLTSASLRVQDYPHGVHGSPSECGDALSRFPHLCSTLIAPLVVEDRMLGNVEFGSTQRHTYDDLSLQRLISAVVRVLAPAIESVQLGGNAAIQDRQREALKSVTSALTAKKDLSTILTQIVSGVSNALHVSSCILRWNQRDNTLHLEAQAGLAEPAVTQVFGQPIALQEQCIMGQTVRHRQALGSSDIVQDAQYPATQAIFAALGVHSIYCYPLVVDNRVYGTLMLCSPEPGGFTPLKTDILSLFANQATIAIHNDTLFQTVHQRNRFQQLVEQLDTQPSDSYADEYALFEQLRTQTQQTFGVSLRSLLQAAANHLLTQHEREDVLALDHKSSFAGTLALLEQSAEYASIRAAMLGELSRLIIQLKQSQNWMHEPWFVIDLNGSCTYMNSVSETFCEITQDPIAATYSAQILVPAHKQQQSNALRIEDVFAKLFGRMRNGQEVKAFLRNITTTTTSHDIRCVLAIQPFEPTNTHAPTDHHYHFTSYPLYNENGQLVAYALRVGDITEQVRDEKNRSALLAAVSHDLRTPLTTIKAAVTGLLQNDVVWEEQDRQAMLEDINSETDHMTGLVNSLVELSRIEMGALTLFKEWCDIEEIYYGIVPKVQSLLAHRTVCLQAQDALPLLYVDHVQIARVFYNLVANAARHSPDYSDIIIAMDLYTDDSEWLRVQIIDKGPGIPEQERERIFTSYSQKSYGNVLGLAICKGIIDAHQGRIWVDPISEQNSSFIFVLPIHPQTALNRIDKPYGRQEQHESKK